MNRSISSSLMYFFLLQSFVLVAFCYKSCQYSLSEEKIEMCASLSALNIDICSGRISDLLTRLQRNFN